MPDYLESHDTVGGSLATRHAEVTVGTLVDIGDDGSAMVNWPGNIDGQPVSAMSMSSYGVGEVGRAVALLFADGDPRRPLIVGLIQHALDAVIEATSTTTEQEDAVSLAAAAGPKTVEIDDERIVLSADKEIVLQCGKASITLTRAGKVVIRGEYVLSRSSGVNQLKGGSVKLN